MSARSHARSYVVAFLALVVLTVLTFGASRIDLGHANVPVALAIAATKSLVVAWVFMHLSDHGGTAKLVAATSIVFVALLAGGVVTDYLTRFEPAMPRDWGAQEVQPRPPLPPAR